ncbi:MAG: FliA/WhiG family RNA polymerase sigma factor [Deltaproteobacteria bacterium]|nr:FliA/WhiG family RNA polymerase sigma factor [Deltaproteobacteria bacterium]
MAKKAAKVRTRRVLIQTRSKRISIQVRKRNVVPPRRVSQGRLNQQRPLPRKEENREKIDMNHVDQIVNEYSSLIRYIAQKIAMKLPPNIDIDDLISAGVIGLMDAISKYDPSRDNKFKTYAEFRIRGAMLDELRAQDWLPRSVREKAKQINRANTKLEKELGRQAREKEIAGELNITLEEYRAMANQACNASMMSIEEGGAFDNGESKNILNILESHKFPSPLHSLNDKDLKKMLVQAIEDLPENQRLVLALYYYEDINLKDIGRVLEVTESRVSQLHTQAINAVRRRIDELAGEELLAAE